MRPLTPGLRVRDAAVLVLDTETTGVDVTADRVVELAAQWFLGGPSQSRAGRINPGVPIPAEATAIHGIGDADVAGCQAFGSVAPGLLALVADADVLCGYNALSYDVPLLNAELERAGRSERLDLARVLDPCVFVRWHMRHLRERTLAAVTASMGLPPFAAHGAMADVRATGRLLFAMLDAGIIPEDLGQALEVQARCRETEEGEFERWSFWLYQHRDDGHLMLGAGKHCGTPLHQVPRDYLRFMLGKATDPPAPVADEFRAACGGGP